MPGHHHAINPSHPGINPEFISQHYFCCTWSDCPCIGIDLPFQCFDDHFLGPYLSQIDQFLEFWRMFSVLHMFDEHSKYYVQLPVIFGTMIMVGLTHLTDMNKDVCISLRLLGRQGLTSISEWNILCEYIGMWTGTHVLSSFHNI